SPKTRGSWIGKNGWQSPWPSPGPALEVGRHRQEGGPSKMAPPNNLTVWDVMNFGAIGDGATDDTAAIQSAINAAATSATGHGGGIVYFPPGNYKVSSTLQITTGGIHLLGPGPSATQLIGANA